MSPKAFLQAIGLAALLLLAATLPASAAAPPLARDLSLVSVDKPGFVELLACSVQAQLACPDGQCTLHVEQVYLLHNRDRVNPATVRLGLPIQVDGQAVDLPEVLLANAQGVALPSQGADERFRALWNMTLERDERRTLRLVCDHPFGTEPLLRWRWEMGLLASWGTVESARVELSLPQYTADDAFLGIEPRSVTLTDKGIIWEYEKPDALPPHEVVLISPPTWQRLQELQAAGAHHDLARLHVALQEAAQRQGLALPDRFGTIVAELQAALAADPADLAARNELATLYRARADALPELRLNYLLLAARELAAALAQQPGDTALATTLSRTYYDAATLASESGDPAGALSYLKKAEEVPGVLAGAEAARWEELTLRWALALAEQGSPSQAVARLSGVLSPGIEDALLRYVPPVVSVRTEVSLAPNERHVRYMVQPYAPAAQATLARLQEIAQMIKAIPPCEATLDAGEDLATLEVRVPYHTLEELKGSAAAIVGAFGAEPDLLAAFVAAPWQNDLRVYQAQRGLWRDRFTYQEHVDLTPLQQVWEAKAQYVSWRLVELRNTPATSDQAAAQRAELEQRLALLALREQHQIWDNLPAGSFWTYRVTFEGLPQEQGSRDWLVSWGQARDLAVDYPVYLGPEIVQGVGVAATLLALWLFLVYLRRKRRRQAH